MFQFFVFRLQILRDVSDKRTGRSDFELALVRLKHLFHPILLFGDDRHILLKGAKFLLHCLLFRRDMDGFRLTGRFVAL